MFYSNVKRINNTLNMQVVLWRRQGMLYAKYQFV